MMKESVVVMITAILVLVLRRLRDGINEERLEMRMDDLRSWSSFSISSSDDRDGI